MSDPLEIGKDALVQASRSQAHLNQLSSAYTSGMLMGYEPVSKAAYVYVFEIKTLAQTLDWACLSSPEHIDHLNNWSEAILDRAREFEDLHNKNALAPSDVFFDDVLLPDGLSEKSVLVMRDEPQAGESNAAR